MKLSVQLMPRTAWFVDYDGSVCPHQEVWEERIYDAQTIYESVRCLAARAGAFFWNTGRRPESLAGVHAGFLNFDGYFVHGSFYKTQMIGQPVPPEVAALASDFISVHPEFKLEVKPSSLRLTPVKAFDLPRLMESIRPLMQATPEGWNWISGPRGTELINEDFTKATALRRELATRPNMIPVAVGDDVLDRPAFAEALARGGYVIAVGGSCGWVTELPHRSDQLIFCEEPTHVLELFDALCKT
ncbi:MAG: hypothetical protein JST16_12870 [Bdellovibrionales bacterium]|nr:hypothetical protein [Bdellovibrionales bacterium]